MPAIINHHICDNASACGGIEVCPVGAFTYNETTKKIEIDNNKCISCGACEKTCPIGAIGVAKTKEDFEELKQAIEDDPRSQEDLFVDRYGADIINEDVLINLEDIDKVIAKSDNVLIELFNDNSINCLLKSIPYKDILSNSKFKKYYRCNVREFDIEKYKANDLPCLLIIKNGKLQKTINGYFDEENKALLFELLI